MNAERDLTRLLADLDVVRRPGEFTFVSGEWPQLAASAHATIREDEGPTYVVTVQDANAAGAPVEFVAAWLTLTVNSALDAVGLTADVAQRLAAVGIACNVIAGFHHDHLLVPATRAAEAIAALRH